MRKDYKKADFRSKGINTVEVVVLVAIALEAGPDFQGKQIFNLSPA